MKRLFRGRELILTTLLTPLLGIIVFVLVVGPLLSQTKGETKIFFGLVNDDNTEEVTTLVQSIVNSDTLRDLAVVYPLSDKETGLKLLSEGKIGVLVYVPEGIYEDIYSDRETYIELTSYTSHSFEQLLLYNIVKHSLFDVEQTRNIIKVCCETVREAGLSDADTAVFADDLFNEGLREYMNRHAVLGKSELVSPLEESFPMQHYFSALFSVFAAFAMLPLIHLTAYDLSSPVFERGLISDRKFTFRFSLARLISGAVLIFISMLIFVPTAIFLQNIEAFHGSPDVDPMVWPALFAALILASLSFSALSLLIGSIFRHGKLAVWTGFFLVLLMALLSGIMIPLGTMPKIFSSVSNFIPLKTVMNIFSNLLFKVEHARFFRDMLILSGLTAVFAIGGLTIVYRRGEVK